MEERMVIEQQSSRELLRNLAHEIKNPLGGLRGSAQLLERELERPELREYTQVITRSRPPAGADGPDARAAPDAEDRALGIHEVLERVRSLVRAEFGVEIARDYDPSPRAAGRPRAAHPGDPQHRPQRRQRGAKTIEFRTRAVRQPTILRQRYRLALELQVVDDGPGVPDEIRDRIFNPLVSATSGTGLGLSLAQTFVQYHQGVIEFDSRPGRTLFRILLPVS